MVDTLNGGAGPVRVVSTPPERSDDETTWRFEEIYRAGEPDLASTSQIVVDAQGRLAALDFGTQQLRIFGPDGALLRTLGGQGGGPGELNGAFGVLAAGNEFLVSEIRNARLSVFEADRGFVRSTPMRFFSYGSTGWDAVIDSTGGIGVLSSGMRSGGTGQWMVRTYDRALTPLDSIGYRAYEDAPTGYAWRIETARGLATVAVPLKRFPGELLDRAMTIWRADEHDEYRIVRFRPPADTLRVVEVRRPRVPVSPAERDAAIEELRGKLAGQGMPTELDWSLVPERHPAIQQISASEEGDLWVRISPAGVRPTRYDVLDPEGRYRGSVSVPGRVKPGVEPVVRGDLFWAVVLDDLDVESILHGRLW